MNGHYTKRPPSAANKAPSAHEFPWPSGYRSAVMQAFDALSEQRLVSRSYGGYEARVSVPKILGAL
jgi:hypothetical protein